MKRAFSLSELHESLDDAGHPSPMRRVKSQDNMLRAIPESNASRVPVLSERELREHFNMPLNEVAKKYGMCTTALKKLCRKYGVMQWPHRKLRSLEKKIASLRAEQRYTSDGQGQLDEEIRKLEAHREALISGSGEGADDEAVAGGWSPTAMSPVDLSELGEVVKHEGDDREGAAPASRASTVHREWVDGCERESGTEERLQQHIQTLEEENSSLRALSRSLMKERQELLTKTSATKVEMSQLRQFCDSLQRQLRHLGEKAAGAAPSGDNETDNMMMETNSRAAANVSVSDGGGIGWGQQHGGGDEHCAVDQPQRAESGGARSAGGGEEGDMHALSWMTPDFDLDELL